VPNFEDRWCNVVRVTDPYGCILDFLYRSHYFLLQAAPLETHENLLLKTLLVREENRRLKGNWPIDMI
jgi:hypothetical protein